MTDGSGRAAASGMGAAESPTDGHRAGPGYRKPDIEPIMLDWGFLIGLNLAHCLRSEGPLVGGARWRNVCLRKSLIWSKELVWQEDRLLV
jgi:hypothetical protein